MSVSQDYRDCGGIPPTPSVRLCPAIFTGIPADRCEEFWDRISPILWRCIVRTDGRHTLLTVKHGIQNGEYGLWAAFSGPDMRACTAALATQIAYYPSGLRDMEIFLCAGDVIPGCLAFLPAIEADAKAKGCRDVFLHGRRGWAKILSSYEESAVVLRKRL